MKASLEYTDDKAVIEAALKERNQYDEWQQVRLQVKMCNGARWLTLDYSEDFENIDLFLGIFWTDAEEEWYWLHCSELIPLPLLCTLLAKFYEKEGIEEWIDTSAFRRPILFQEN